jgi:protein SCO1/2
MKNGSRFLQTIVWGALGLALAIVVVLFFTSAGKRSNLPVVSTVQPFVLTSQIGQTVTLQDLKGKVWVADVIFTICPGPCPKMTEEMSKLQKAFPATEPIRFVTLTTHPENDSPEILKAYSEKFGADPQRWFFLTGPKKEILANLAVGSLKLAAVEKDENSRENANDLFIHSTMFVLVDKTGKVRGFYESLEPGFQEKIQKDIKSLLGEGE